MAPRAENEGSLQTRWSHVMETHADSTFHLTNSKQTLRQHVRMILHVGPTNLPLNVPGSVQGISGTVHESRI